MSLILLSLESNQRIKLNSDTPVIIGRGNIQGCFDKRVSRNHGKITCTVDGKVRVAALHCNPCFFKRNGVPPVLQLNKNEEEILNEGDYFGLLPKSFWFKVTSDKEIEIKNEPDNSTASADVPYDEINQTIVLENSNKSPSDHGEIKINEELECMHSDKSKNNLNSLTSPVLNKESNSMDTSTEFGTPEFEKTKRLPLWMYQIDEPTAPDESLKKHVFENETPYTKGKKQKIVQEVEIKKELESKFTKEIKVEDEGINISVPSTSKAENVDETSNLCCKTKPKEEEKKDNIEKDGYESGVCDEKVLRTKRPICKYEDNCYRKNPQHKLDFSHPGDSDYVKYEERSICQYGDKCHRKNQKHKVEFWHPPPDSNCLSLSSPSSPGSRASSPLPAKRRRKNINKQIFDYEDDDEFDLEDPFKNDASSDEYIPSDLESEEEELDTSREDD